MRGQDSSYNCGPYALLNALRALGVQRTASELESACKTTMTLGTSTTKLVKAVNQIDGCMAVRFSERRRDVALLKLRCAIADGRPVILSWQGATHWVAVVGMLGARYLVADAAEAELVLSFTVDEVAALWDEDGSFEGVII